MTYEPFLTHCYYTMSIVYTKVHTAPGFIQSSDKCIVICSHYYSIIHGSFAAFKIFSALPIHPSFSLNPWQPWIFLTASHFSIPRSHSWNHAGCRLLTKWKIGLVPLVICIFPCQDFLAIQWLRLVPQCKGHNSETPGQNNSRSCMPLSMAKKKEKKERKKLFSNCLVSPVMAGVFLISSINMDYFSNYLILDDWFISIADLLIKN